jgi:plastocyanin
MAETEWSVEVHLRCDLRAGVMALAMALLPSVGQPQTASVSGQVTMLERKGEVTEDLQNVVVFLTPTRADSTVIGDSNVTNSVIALQSRQFSPRVRVVVRGSRIAFPNQDPFSHNVFSKTHGGFDTGTFGRGKTREQVFAEPGVYALYCNVHPRMTAFVITLGTPLYTQAALDGRFSVDSVPPGDYELHAWHDRAAEKVRKVRVGAAGLRNLRIELDARGYRYVQHKNKFGQVYTSATGDRY